MNEQAAHDRSVRDCTVRLRCHVAIHWIHGTSGLSLGFEGHRLMIIDVFSHVLPPRYLKERNARAGNRLANQYGKYFHANPGLTDLDARFRAMDKYPDIVQLITIAGPNVESVLDPADAVICARIANDEMAELVAKYPDRFAGAAACLPMSDVDAALAEADRALDDSAVPGRGGVHRHLGEATGLSRFLPLFEKMASRNLPILLHPRRTNTTPDYPGEQTSRYSRLHKLWLAV